MANLDPAKPDHQLVAEARSHSLAFNGLTSVLSHDVGPLVAARSIKISVIKIPDVWLLEPESDEKEKEIWPVAATRGLELALK